MAHKSLFLRQVKNKVMKVFSFICFIFGAFFIVWIFKTLLIKGCQGLSLTLFTHMTPPPGKVGGLLNACVGSLLMVGYALFIGTPLGIATALYFTEYGKNNKLVMCTRFINDIFLSLPSIIIGLFIYEFYVLHVGGFSAWAGVGALTLITIPIVIKTCDTTLQLVPPSLREAAASLGATPFQVIYKIIIPVIKSGLFSGIFFALARISGETAPLLFTALNNQFWSTDMNRPMASLPVMIFQYGMSAYEDWQRLAWNGALLLTVFVLGINILLRLVFRKNIKLY